MRYLSFVVLALFATITFSQTPPPSIAPSAPVVAVPSGADQLNTFLTKGGLNGMAVISSIGFGNGAPERWRMYLSQSGWTTQDIEIALAMVDSITLQATNSALLLTATPGTHTPAVVVSTPKTSTKPATPKPPAAKPTAKPVVTDVSPGMAAMVESRISVNDVTLPTSKSEAPPGWDMAEIVTPEQLHSGDVVFVYSPYQFVVYQQKADVNAPLPEPMTFWRSGVVTRVETGTRRFGLSMDFVQTKNLRTVWTVVNWNECLEIRRFAKVPYSIKGP